MPKKRYLLEILWPFFLLYEHSGRYFIYHTKTYLLNRDSEMENIGILYLYATYIIRVLTYVQRVCTYILCAIDPANVTRGILP